MTIATDGANVYIGFASRGSVLYRRSLDTGATWSPLITVAGRDGGDANVAPKFTAHDGGLDAAWAVLKGPFSVGLMYGRSADGLTWAEPQPYAGNILAGALAHTTATLVMLATAGGADTALPRAVVTTLRDEQ